jgi:acyl transferase domain-containing protein
MGLDRGSRNVPLAIVGMACRLPGAPGLDAFWQLLVEGRSAVALLPADRFDRELYYDPRPGNRNQSYTDLGAIVSRGDVDDLPVSPGFARKTDITHRIMCQVASEAFRHAGLDPCDLPQRNTGVYVGHTIGSGLAGDAYHALGIEESLECLREPGVLDEFDSIQKQTLIEELTARVRSENSSERAGDPDLGSPMAAGLISKAFGLSGPFVSVNSACASSLQALVIAARALQRGAIDMALVGGASVCSRDWLVLFSQSTALSASGSRPFDHRADGLVVAEGYVALVVKTLEQAHADGSRIQAVIRGLGISTDGKGRSLWAPRSEGQVAAIRRAYRAGVDLADVGYIEAHATATQLGDATEIESLSEAFSGVLPAGKKIPIASVKANIGHALEAAGLAGVLKAVLCLQKGTIPGAINIDRLNPKIDWERAPFFVPQETIPWPDAAPGKPRRAGVNAFGIGGLNVHVVLDASCEVKAAPATRSRLAPSHSNEGIAVVGLGCVFPDCGANNVAAFRELLRSAREAIQLRTNGTSPSGGRFGLVDVRAGEREAIPGSRKDRFDYDWRRHRIPPKEIELADPLQFMALDAADQAIQDAGYHARSTPPERTGVVVGTEFTGDFDFRLQLALRLPHTQKLLREQLRSARISDARSADIVHAFAERWHARWPVLLDGTGSFSASSLAVRIVKSWNLMGGAAALDSGATSGMAALSASIDLLDAGDCDLMICGAAHRASNPAALAALERAGALSRTSPSRPFEYGGNGYVPGEGAVVLALKRLSDARRDNDRVHAVLHGISACYDQSRQAIANSLQTAITRAGWRPQDLAFVLCDACGVAPIDEPLVRGVIASQQGCARTEPLILGSVVRQIGHTGAASSLASLLAAILAVHEEDALNGVLGCESPLAPIVRNRAVVRCSKPRTPFRSSGSTDCVKSAVISQDRGLAYCALIEQAPAPQESLDLLRQPTAAIAASFSY